MGSGGGDGAMEEAAARTDPRATDAYWVTYARSRVDAALKAGEASRLNAWAEPNVLCRKGLISPKQRDERIGVIVEAQTNECFAIDRETRQLVDRERAEYEARSHDARETGESELIGLRVW